LVQFQFSPSVCTLHLFATGLHFLVLSYLEGTISQCTLQLVNTSNILSNIITNRILNAMVGFSRVFQVLATCKKVWTFKVFQKPFDSLDEKTNHYGDNFLRCVLSQLSVFSLGIVWIERICKTLKTVFQPISKHIQDCL